MELKFSCYVVFNIRPSFIRQEERIGRSEVCKNSLLLKQMRVFMTRRTHQR